MRAVATKQHEHHWNATEVHRIVARWCECGAVEVQVRKGTFGKNAFERAPAHIVQRVWRDNGIKGATK